MHFFFLRYGNASPQLPVNLCSCCHGVCDQSLVWLLIYHIWSLFVSTLVIIGLRWHEVVSEVGEDGLNIAVNYWCASCSPIRLICRKVDQLTGYLIVARRPLLLRRRYKVHSEGLLDTYDALREQLAD